MLEETNHNFFCSNCQFNIEDEKLYKIHYKSDFHRYNIKRKLLALQPATYEQYLKRKNSTKSLFFMKIIFFFKSPSKKLKNMRNPIINATFASLSQTHF